MTCQQAANGRIYTVRDATIGDVDTLFQSMRAADYDEVLAGSGRVYQTLRLSYLGSMLCKAVECEDGLVCIYGVSMIDAAQQIGCPWMLGTTLLDHKHKRAPLVIGRECLQSMYDLFPGGLRNYVDARNQKSLRWLKWLGFRFDTPINYGAMKIPFYPFAMGEKACATLH